MSSSVIIRDYEDFVKKSDFVPNLKSQPGSAERFAEFHRTVADPNIYSGGLGFGVENMQTPYQLPLKSVDTDSCHTTGLQPFLTFIYIM